MLDLLVGIDIARKASEQQYAGDTHAARRERLRGRRSPVRRMMLFRRSRDTERGQSPPSVAGRANAL